MSTVGTGAFLAGITWLCASRALDGHLSVGQAIAAIGLAQFVIGPINRIGYGLTEAAAVKASAARVADVRAASFAIESGRRPPRSDVDPDHDHDRDPDLEIAGLRAGTLDGLDLVVDAGETGRRSSALPRATPRHSSTASHASEGSIQALRPWVGSRPRRSVPDAWRRLVLVSSGESELFETSLERTVADTASSRLAVDDAFAGNDRRRGGGDARGRAGGDARGARAIPVGRAASAGALARALAADAARARARRADDGHRRRHRGRHRGRHPATPGRAHDAARHHQPDAAGRSPTGSCWSWPAGGWPRRPTPNCWPRDARVPAADRRMSESATMLPDRVAEIGVADDARPRPPAPHAAAGRARRYGCSAGRRRWWRRP